VPAAAAAARLADPAADPVLIDGAGTLSGTALRVRIEALGAALGRAPEVRRLGLVVDRVETLLPALVLAARRRLRLLLIRPELRTGAPWEVDAWLGGRADDLELVARPGGPPPAAAEIVLTTSGTTGTPKAALHPLARLLGRIAPPRDAPAAAGRWLLTYHPASFAGVQVILSALVAGMPLIAAGDGRMATLAGLALAHRPTHVSGTPTFWRTFLGALGGRAGELPLRAVTLGGEAADPATLDLVRRRFPQARVTHIYASTEAGAVFAVKDGRAGFPAAWLESGVEGARLRIRDGVLEVRSPRAMAGYLDRPAAQGADGWLATGDLVAIEADRVLFRGRVDAVINVGGAKVLPDEVEAVLLGLPFIRDVRVFGRPNPITGTLVAAEVVLDPAQAAAAGAPADPAGREAWARTRITGHARATLLAHQIPRLIGFVGRIETGFGGKKARG
jgi:acyl-CoA synthetase (AMP-forming)/AMP-acid ligase II